MLSFLIVFLLIFNLNYFECSASLEPFQNIKSNLTKFICDAADEISNHEVKTIAIVKFRNNFPSRFFDELHNCMPANVAMVQLDLESSLVKVKVKEAKFVVVFGDDVDESQFIQLVDERNPEQILSHMAKFLFISTKRKSWGLSEVLPKNGILNFASAFEDKNGEISVEVSNHFVNTSEILSNVSKHEIISKLYPDKLSNMHENALRIFTSIGMPHFDMKNNRLISPHIHLMDLVTEKLNATPTYIFSNVTAAMEVSNIAKGYFESHNLDITASMIPVFAASNKVISYFQVEVCALVPLPPESYEYSLYFMRTFRGAPIRLIFLYTLCYMILWKLYRLLGKTQGSVLNVPFGMYATLFGQSFNFRTISSVMHFVLMQNIFFNILINNLYQASLTASVMTPSLRHRYESTAELFQNGHNFTIALYVSQYLRGIEEYEKAVSDGRVKLEIVYSVKYPHTITIGRCDILEDFLTETREEDHYIFSMNIGQFYTFHETGYMNPYTEKIQRIVDRIFSAGLHQPWRQQAEVDVSKAKADAMKEELLFIGFDHLVRSFILIANGIVGGILILLLEIFYNSFLTKLSWTRFSWENFMRKWAWTEKKRKINVRRIQVRPINETQDETEM